MSSGLVILALMAIPLVIALITLALEYLGTYGVRAHKFARHRRTFRMIGRLAMSVSLLTLMLSLIAWTQLPA